MHQASDEIKRIRVLDVPVDYVNMSLALKYVEEAVINDKKGSYILAVNAEKFMQLRKNLSLKKIFEKASLLLPDGVGAVWALRWRYRLMTERVPSVDLMQNICKQSAVKGYRIFIYGAKEEVNKKAVEKFHSLYPGINIVGRSNGYVSQDDMEGLIDEINRSEADILFVALGSPKQELWIQKYLPKLNVKVCQGIGGTLDAITGQTKRAPALFQKLPLEWLYRLIIDPKRIRRQAIIPYFLFKVFTQKRVTYPSTDYTDFHRLK
jgi:N-acetylglucosaminyldiphosphoundecaprenol N-acetyl-beta-D-mannosaminyltransferase